MSDRIDKIARDADWQDGMNAFRLKVIDQLEGILEVLDLFDKDIESIKKQIKGDPK